jgi:curli biogenesis system outer membrane secretion channel CsgG
MLLQRAIVLSCVVLFILFSGCATTQETPGSTTTIAVWDLENLSCDTSTLPDLKQMLSAEIMETIRTKSSYDLVERQRLLLILEELNLGSSDLADESTRLKIGKMVGATQMVFGAYQVIGDTMRLDLRLVEVSTGKIVRAAQKTSSSSDIKGWLNAARSAAEELL